MSASVDLVLVSRTLQSLLEQRGQEVCYDCKATRQMLSYAPDSAAAPTGLLPGFLAAADAVWREATGHGFSLDITPDPATVLGFTVRGINGGTFATVMLCVMEVLAQVGRDDVLLANDLARVWREANMRAAPVGRVTAA